MVAVVSGNGLGLGNTSLAQLGQSQGGAASLGQAGGGAYVNTATGNLILQNADEGLLFDGLPLNVLRSYNSQGQLNGQSDWRYGFSRSVGGLTGTLDTAGSTITRTDDDGSTVIYTYDSSRGAYVSTGQNGVQDTLSWNATASTWTYSDAADQLQETYNASGQLTALRDTATGASYSFSYSNGQLSQITAGDGDSLTFDYNTSGQLIGLTVQEVPPGQGTPVTRQQVSYGYDASGRLGTVTTLLASDTASNSASYTTTYTYDGSSDRVASVTQSDGTTVSYGYTEDAQGAYQVTSVTTGIGADAQTLTLSYAANSTTVTDALGRATTYQSNATGQLVAVLQPTVNGSRPTASYTYDANGNVLTMTDPLGAVTYYSYDANGNLLSVEDPTGHTVSYTYDANDQVTSQTVTTVPAQGTVGQSGYVAPSGAQTTYYVYDSQGRLSYVIDPLGDVTEHDYATPNGISVLTSTEQYVGTTYATGGLSPTALPALSDLQAWVASTPVQAVLSQSVRTDYSYDARGQLIQQIQWDRLNAQGQGTLSGDTGAIVTTFTYSAQGQLLQTGTQRGSNRSTVETTSYTYDGLGRLLSSTDPLGNVTTHTYTDATATQITTQANGLVTTQVRNTAGLLLSSTQSASGQASRTTTYSYDAAGQLRAVTDPTGATTTTFYDADGRVAGTVDPIGAVTAYTYDADGQVIAETAYATTVSTAGWSTSQPTTLPVPTANANDRTSHTVYDAAGRVIATISPAGEIVTTTYDGEGHAVATRAYSQTLTGSALTTFLAAPNLASLPTSSSDRLSQAFYDADGQVIATVDADGNVTRTTYDSAGRVIATTAYATPVSVPVTTAPTPTPSANDQTTRTYYNDAGQVVAQIDADGYLTTIADDETTHTTTTTRYATALTPTQQSALTGAESVAALLLLLGPSPASEISTCVYDADGRKQTETATDGTITAYTYNAVGQRTQTTVTPVAGQGAARTTGATYDAFGALLTATDATQATTTYTYNALGQRITATDALGNTVTSYYDADGRLAYTVQGQLQNGVRNAVGAITAYTYNAFGQISSTRQLAALATLTTSGSSTGATLDLATATLTDLANATMALANPATDAVTTTTYTLDGQAASTIDGRGYQSAYQYDAFGDVTQQQTQLSQPGTALSAANSSTTTYRYDALGQRIGETDGAGSMVARSSSVVYDAFGRITQTTDGNGNVVTVAYDALGQQVSSSQLVGGAARSTQTTYDAFGHVLTQTDALGHTTTYQYDIATHTVTLTTPDGVTMTTVQDAFGDTVSVTDGGGHTTISTYDADGRVLTVTDALGQVSGNQYDADGDLLQSTDASGRVVTYTYDANGQVLTRTVDPSGLHQVTTYVYDGLGRTLSVTDPMGSVTTMSYDADGDVLTQVQDANGLRLTTTYTYDGAGKTLTVTVGSGASATTTQFIYDNLERLSQQIVDPSGLHQATSYTYDANNNVVSVTDANGNVTRYLYNEANQKVVTVDPTGAVTQYVYDADGRLTTTRGYATRLSSTQLANLSAAPTLTTLQGFNLATTSQDSYQQSVYNADGQVVYTLNGVALNPTLYTYNAAGQVTQTRRYANALSSTAIGTTAVPGDIAALLVPSANDIVTTTAYDADGQAVYQIDGAGDVTRTFYDAAGRVIGTLSYATPLSSTVLTGLGGTPTPAQIAAVVTTSANDRRSYALYDSAGQPVLTIDPSGAVVATTYDADGRVTSTHAYATALSATTLSALGNAPTLAQVTALLTSSANDPISYRVYDAVGELRYAIDPNGYVTEQRYDSAGRVTETLAYAHAVSTTGQTTALQQGSAVSWIGSQVGGVSGTNSDASAEVTLTLYDSAGHARFVVQQNANGTIGTVTERRYDANGNVIAQIRYGQTLALSTGSALSAQLTTASVTAAVSGMTNTQATRYVYDTDNRAIYTIDAADDVVQTTYDALGRITQVAQLANPIVLPGSLTLATVAAAVTAAGGLTGARLSTTTYDSRGDVLSTGDALGINASYTYDGRGIKTSMTNRDGAVWHYSYDTAGRLVQTQSPAVTVGSYSPVDGSFQTAANQFIYTTTVYDAFGEVHSVSQGSGSSAASIGNVTSTTYGYDADGRQVQTTNAVNVTTRVTYNALGQAVVSQDGNGHTSYRSYTLDGQLAYAVDGTGDVTAYTYDAYGNPTAATAYATALNTAAITGWSAGQPLSLAQVQQGLVTSAQDRTVTTTYNQLNQVTQVQLSSIPYDASMGVLSGASATGSPTTTYSYDAYGNVTRTSVLIQGAITSGSTTTPAIWATTTTYYDALNRAVMVITPTGDDTAPQGYVTTTRYDTFGDVGTVTQYAQAISTAALTSTPPAVPAAGNATIGFDRTTTYTYDALGRTLSQTDTGAMAYTGGTLGQLGGSFSNYTANNASSVTSYTYDGEGRVLTQTVNGTTTATTYDALGRTLSVTAPTRQVLASNWQTLLIANPSWDLSTAALYITVSPVTSYVYDAHGNALSTHVAADTLSTQAWSYYDAIGRMIEQFDPTGIAHFTTYDGNNNVLTQSYTLTNATPVLVTTTHTYDADNRQLSVVTQRAGTSTPDSATYVKYNAFGEVIAQGDNATNYELTYSYDNVGNRITAPNTTNGAMHTFSYDLAGHEVVDASTVTGGGAQTWTHDFLDLSGRVVTEYTPTSVATSGTASATPATYTYDRWGNVLSQVDNNGNRTTYEYDSQNHLIQQTEAAVVVVSATGAYSTQNPVMSWFYNIDGELMVTRDENGNLTGYAYDAAGNLHFKEDATTAITYTSYDALGRAVAQQTPTVQTVNGPDAPINSTTYNALNQVIGQGAFLQAGPGATRTLQSEGSYVLNSHGDRIQSTDAMGNTTRVSYDSQHRILTSTTPLSETTTYVYDVNGHLIHQTSAAGYTQSWTYNYVGQMLSHVDESGATYTYTYDASSGLLVSETSNWTATGPSGSTTSTLNFQYEANGEIAQLSETVNGVASTYAYQYDANGNETREVDTTQDGSGAQVATQTLIGYDSHNRLQEVTQENGAGTVANMRTVYVYDAVGNRRAVFAQSAYANGTTAATPISLAAGAPTVTAALATQTIQPGSAVNYTVPASSFSDPLGMGLTYTATGLPSWLSFNASTHTLSGTPPIAPASYTVTITAMDVLGRSVSSTVTITVPAVLPQFTGTPPTQSVQYTPFSFTVPGATDANGLGVTYTAGYFNGTAWVALPSWITFNAGTRTFSGQAPLNGGAGSAGTYELAIWAQANGTSVINGVAFNLTVAAVTAPQMNQPANQSVVINNGFSFAVPAATDTNGLAMTYTAGYWNGSAWVGLPSWISFNPNTLTFSGTAPGTNQVATLAVWATAVGTSQVGGESFTLTVNAPPFYNGQDGTTGPAHVQKLPVQSSMNINAASIFTNPTGRAMVYQFVWGFNGTGGAVTFNTSTGIGTLLATGTAGSTYPYTIIATDPVDGLSASVTYNLQIQSKIGTPPGPPHTQVVTGSPLEDDGANADTSTSSTLALTPSPAPITSSAQIESAQMIATPQMLPSPELLPIDSPPRIGIGNPAPAPAPVPVTAPAPVGTAPNPPPPPPPPPPIPGFVANWFTYDQDNRVQVANGSLQNGQIVITTATNSGQNAYDLAGNLTQYTTVNTSGQMLSERAFYDIRSDLTLLQAQTTVGGVFASYQSGTYDLDGRLVRSTTYQLPNHSEAGIDANTTLVTFRDDGWIASDTVYTYNADGELADQSLYAEDSAQDLVNLLHNESAIEGGTYANQEKQALGAAPAPGATTDGALFLVTDNSYAPSAGYGYDADQNLLGYHVITGSAATIYNNAPTQGIASYTNAFARQNSALITTTTDNAGNTTTNTYNALGELTKTSGLVSGTQQTTVMAYTADSQILQKTTSVSGQTNNEVTNYLYAQDNGLGSEDNLKGINVLATTGGFSNGVLGTQGYTVQSGDTLDSVAQRMFGDSRYAYLIAQANGLPLGGPLAVGMLLHIPQVTTGTNSANTFQPYAQSAIVSASQSACVTTAQMVSMSIEAVLNQQSALATTMQDIQKELTDNREKVQQKLNVAARLALISYSHSFDVGSVAVGVNYDSHYDDPQVTVGNPSYFDFTTLGPGVGSDLTPPGSVTDDLSDQDPPPPGSSSGNYDGNPGNAYNQGVIPPSLTINNWNTVQLTPAQTEGNFSFNFAQDANNAYAANSAGGLTAGAVVDTGAYLSGNVGAGLVASVAQGMLTTSGITVVDQSLSTGGGAFTFDFAQDANNNSPFSSNVMPDANRGSASGLSTLQSVGVGNGYAYDPLSAGVLLGAMSAVSGGVVAPMLQSPTTLAGGVELNQAQLAAYNAYFGNDLNEGTWALSIDSSGDLWAYGNKSFVDGSPEIHDGKGVDNLPAISASPSAEDYASAGLDLPVGSSIAETMGVTQRQMDYDIARARGRTTVGDAAWNATRYTAYKAWNFLSVGFLGRNDARLQLVDQGKLTQAEYEFSSELDAVGSLGSLFVGGEVGGAALERFGSGYLGQMLSGGLGAAAGDFVLQGTQMSIYGATNGDTGQSSLSLSELGGSFLLGSASSGIYKFGSETNINVGSDGISITTSSGSSYGLQSPLYLDMDGAYSQLNSGLPIGVRSPLVSLGDGMGAEAGAQENAEEIDGPKTNIFTPGQVATLNRLGVDPADHAAFASGEITSFQFPTAGGDDVYGFLQYKDGSLTSQLFSISNTAGGAPAAFRTFASGSNDLAASLGLESFELQGGSIINPSLANALSARGFLPKIVPVPDALGGGTQEVLFKTMPVKR
jgi:YD repeat-containing protein